jgi:hypothetical protein
MTTQSNFSAILFATLVLPASALAGSASGGTWNISREDAYREHFADAVEDYTGTGNSNLGQCIDGVSAMKNQLSSTSYTNYRIFTDASASSNDWQSATDQTWADGGDLAYFSGHGNSGVFVMNGAVGDSVVWYNETQWGNGDVEVVAMDACKTLDAAGRTNFGNANVNDGVHWILGFESNANDTAVTATNYGYYLRSGYGIGLAWVTATRDGHDATQTGAYVRFTSTACNTASETLTSLTCDPTSGVTTATYRWSL